jgi:hypothetical protein
VASHADNILGENAGNNANKIKATRFSERANKVCGHYLKGMGRNIIRLQWRLTFSAVNLCTLALIASCDIPCYVFVKSRPPIVLLDVLLHVHKFRMASSWSVVSCAQDIC